MHTIESLQDRIATLERLLESVPQVRDARCRIEAEERRKRERAFACAAASDRNAMIAAMTDTDLRVLVGACSEEEQARVYLDCPDDQRSRVWALLPASKRLVALVEIEHAIRSGTVPQYVTVHPVLKRGDDRWLGIKDRDVPVTEAQAAQLRALGLHVEEPTKRNPSHTWQRPPCGELGEWSEITSEQWAAIISIDPELAVRITEGTLAAESLSPGQCAGLYRSKRLAALERHSYSTVTGAQASRG